MPRRRLSFASPRVRTKVTTTRSSHEEGDTELQRDLEETSPASKSIDVALALLPSRPFFRRDVRELAVGAPNGVELPNVEKDTKDDGEDVKNVD
jgi:hypothetical protein